MPYHASEAHKLRVFYNCGQYKITESNFTNTSAIDMVYIDDYFCGPCTDLTVESLDPNQSDIYIKASAPGLIGDEKMSYIDFTGC